MRPLRPEDIVRGQYVSYRDEQRVAKIPMLRRFVLAPFIDSWRWAGFHGICVLKCLAATAAEVLIQLKPPPQKLFADSAPENAANYLRFQLSPRFVIALRLA